MLPRTHIILGALFSLVLWILLPNTSWFFISLVFLSSFLIDFDHYAASVMRTGKFSLLHSFDYHKIQGVKQEIEKRKGLRRKGDFHLFHTIEFHILIALLGFFWPGFLYIFLGMFFHSMMDIIHLVNEDYMHRREYLLVNWIRKKLFMR